MAPKTYADKAAEWRRRARAGASAAEIAATEEAGVRIIRAALTGTQSPYDRTYEDQPPLTKDELAPRSHDYLHGPAPKLSREQILAIKRGEPVDAPISRQSLHLIRKGKLYGHVLPDQAE